MTVLFHVPELGALLFLLGFLVMQILMTSIALNLFFSKSEKYSVFFTYIVSAGLYMWMALMMKEDIRGWFVVSALIGPVIAMRLYRRRHIDRRSIDMF